MVVYCVNVFVKEDAIKQFIEATEINHINTRKEPGNLRFDVIQNSKDKSLFMLYEVYKDSDSVKKHKETEHYLQWRKTVEPFMAKAREGIEYAPLYPRGESQW